MGAVTSKEGYNFPGKKFCKDIFHFQNDGPTTPSQGPPPPPPPPPPPTPPPPFTLSPFEKLTSDSHQSCYTAVFSVVTQRYGCGADYILKGFHSKSSP